MRHLIVEKQNQCVETLAFFFHQGFSRFDVPVSSPQFKEDVYLLAKKIYKRGLSDQTQLHCASIPKLSFLSCEELILKFKKNQTEKTFFFLDKGFHKWHEESIKEIFSFPHFIYSPDETSKNLDTVVDLIKAIPEGTTHLVSIGGGVTSDICGFAAGLLNLKWDLVPTTLLACVDAGIGGKTGVNFFPYGKNQLGLFYESQNIFVVPEFLKTLPSTEVYCGLAEALKHVWISGQFDPYCTLFEKIRVSFCDVSFEEWVLFIQLNYKIKSFVVEKDPWETSNIRNCLNFGHTIAHVLESLGQQKKIEPIPHGMAVAFGMKFWIDHGFVKNKNQKWYDFLCQLIQVSGYQIRMEQPVCRSDILTSLREDKKKKSKRDVIPVSLPEYGVTDPRNSGDRME